MQDKRICINPSTPTKEPPLIWYDSNAESETRSVTIQVKAAEQYLPSMVLFITP